MPLRLRFLLGVVVASLASARSVAESDFSVVINEVNYNPFTDNDRDEFVELHNRGPAAVDLKGWKFTEGISFTFPAGASIGAHGYLVVSPDVTRAKLRYGIANVAGPYTGKLDNGGEVLTLVNARGAVINRIHYLDDTPWPSHADGLGPTLELGEPDEPNDQPQRWGSSLFLDGTPGRENSRLRALGGVKTSVVINEVLQADASGNGFIEIYNAAAAAVDVSGYSIVDSRGARFMIPAVPSLASGALLAFSEAQLGFPPALTGATYALAKDDGTTWVDGLRPSSASAGASFGRFPDGKDDEFVMTSPSPGLKNQVSLETNVVVNEILYHPPFVAPSGNCVRQCSDPDQWIELHNRGGSDVDVTGWSLSKAVDFTVPALTSIPAGGFLVITADRTRFLTKHPGFDPTRVVGGWTRSLGRGADTINLNDALGNRVDHVNYGDGTPFNDESPADNIDDRTIASSEWPNAADSGQGRTLELESPFLDNRAGAAWTAGPAGGTPGARNIAFDSTPPPVVWDVVNSPAVPRSTDPVQVTCRVSSVSPVVKVEALWHLEPSGAPASVQLLDNGLSGDGPAGDGVYGGSIPARSSGVVGFQVRVQAQDAQTALVPRSPAVAPYIGFKGPYYLYQVDNSTPPATGAATYRVVMTQSDLSQLDSRPVTSNVLLPCTFVADGKAYHTLGLRIRGEHSRDETRKPYRIDFPPERSFQGIEHLNLNSVSVENEILVADLFRRAGLPGMQEWAVNLIFQGSLDSQRVYKEDLNGDFLDRYFGGSGKGNLYRAIDPSGPAQGDLSYLGTNPASYAAVYEKKSNKEENDYSDVIDLCRAFDRTQTTDSEFPVLIQSLIDAEEWARFFAIQGAISNDDGSIDTNVGEDYFLYQVPDSSSRPDRGKWLLLPWDVEETFTDSSERLFRPTIATVRRFLTHPDFAPLYYANLAELRDGVFSREEMRKSFVTLENVVPQNVLNALDTYFVERNGFFSDQMPGSLSAGAGGGALRKLIRAGDVWRYFKGRSEPSGGNKSWSNRGFNDTTWLQGATGIGYGDGDDATVLDDMENSYTTVYARKVFTVSDPAQIGKLELSVDYDDGFVAYLNGQEVARRGAPGAANSFVPFSATASNGPVGREAGTVEVIDLSSFRSALVAGDNVLAAQVLNVSKDSSDFSFIPELLSAGLVTGAGCGTVLYATAPTVTLSGRANAGLTRAIKVNGSPAEYDSYAVQWWAQVALAPGENAVKVEALDGGGAAVESLDLRVIRLPRALTPVGGTLGAATSWTAAGGPYLMTQTVTVTASAQLTIEPGTFIAGQAGTSIVVRGELMAQGTHDQPILFRSFSCDGPMGGIAFDNTGVAAGSPEHHLQFVDLEGGLSPAGFLGTVAVVNSKLLVEDCTFRDLFSNAIDGVGSRLEVRRSLFERIHQGIHSTRSTVVVLDSTFSNMTGNNDSINFDGSGPGGEKSRIARSFFENGSGDGLDLRNTTVDVQDSIFFAFGDRAISLEGPGPLGEPTLDGNLLHDNWTGLSLANGVQVSGNHDTISGNQYGIELLARNGAADGGHATFHSLIIRGSTRDVLLDQRSSVDISFSDLDSTLPGQGNITLDPLFADEIGDDFSLVSGSPAIATGRGGSDMGAFPFGGTLTNFIRADANENGTVEIADVILILEYLFRSNPGPTCLDRLDANDDGGINISDPMYILFFRFGGGQAPPAPFPLAGVDSTGDDLPCR